VVFLLLSPVRGELPLSPFAMLLTSRHGARAASKFSPLRTYFPYHSETCQETESQAEFFCIFNLTRALRYGRTRPRLPPSFSPCSGPSHHCLVLLFGVFDFTWSFPFASRLCFYDLFSALRWLPYSYGREKANSSDVQAFILPFALPRSQTPRFFFTSPFTIFLCKGVHQHSKSVAMHALH